MNLRRHLLVLRRYRWLVLAGALLGVALAILAVFRVSPDGLQWRSSQTWTSTSTLYVTQRGFPDGRVVLADPQPVDPSTAPATTRPSGSEQFADPARFANLAIVYTYFAQSAEVRRLIAPGLSASQLSVTPAPAAMNSSQTLPVLSLATRATTPREATRLNAAAIVALRGYLARQQRTNHVPLDNRVRVDVLNPPSAAKLETGHSITPAFVAFVLALAGALALAYCLDNLYPPKPEEELVEARVTDQEESFDALPLDEAWPSGAAAPTRLAVSHRD